MRQRRSIDVWGRLSLAVSLCLTAAVAGWAQEGVVAVVPETEGVNPHTSAADIAAGGKSFATTCSLCHGADARGELGPDLTRGRYRTGSTDQALFRTVRFGIRGTDMPGTYRPDTEIWQMIAYLRSLSEGSKPVELPGNVQQGRRLYQTRGGCIDCHRIGGEGGRLGPNLSDVGWIRSPEHLRASLVAPNDTLHPRYRTVVVVLRDGSEVRGVLRSEDSYSIQLLDELENLRSFDKQSVQRVEKPQESLMPPMSALFRGRDLDHLIAYLYSLKGEMAP